jgi:hypothetical protein
MFMDENQARTIEQIAVAFRDRFQLGHQIRKPLNVAAAKCRAARACRLFRPPRRSCLLPVCSHDDWPKYSQATGTASDSAPAKEARRVPYLAKAVAKILGEIDHRDVRVLLPIYRKIVRLALPRNRLGLSL